MGAVASDSGTTAPDRLHIQTVGHGRALVLVHGWAMHSGIFEPLIEPLASHYSLHLVDLPGHGRSRTDTRLDLDAIATELVRRIPAGAVWAGWSLGGWVALQAAYRAPSRIGALALIASSPRFVTAADWSFGVDASVFHQFARGLETDFQATVSGFLELEAHGSRVAAAQLQALRQEVFRHGPPSLDALLQGLTLLQTRDLRPAVEGLESPSLWIAGRRDRLVRAAAMRWAAATAAHGHYLELDSGHMPFLSDTQAVADALIQLGSH